MAVKLRFQLGINDKDKVLLLQSKIGCCIFGVYSPNIYASQSPPVQFIVQSVKDLAIIINHFDKFPLLSQKKADFFYFEDKSFILC